MRASCSNEYIASREKRRRPEGAASHFVHQLLSKRLLSSPAAFASRSSSTSRPSKGKRKSQAPSGLDERILRRAIAKTEEDYADDDTRESAEAEADRRGKPPIAPADSTDERRMLVERLRAMGRSRQAETGLEGRSAMIDWLKEQPAADGAVERSPGHPVHRIPRPRSSGCTRSSPAMASAASAWRCSSAAWTRREREAIKAAFQADPRGVPRPHPARHRCRLGRHRPPEPLQPADPRRDSLQPERDGAAERPHRPSRAKQREVVIWHPVDAERWPRRRHPACAAEARCDARRHGQRQPGHRAAVARPPRRSPPRARHAPGREADERARRYVKAERELRERIAKLHERLTTTRSEQHLTPDRIERVRPASLSRDDKPDLVQPGWPHSPMRACSKCRRSRAHGRAASTGSNTRTRSASAPSPSTTRSRRAETTSCSSTSIIRWCRCAFGSCAPRSGRATT